MNGHRQFLSHGKLINGNGNTNGHGNGSRRNGPGRVRFPDEESNEKNAWDPVIYFVTTVLVIICITGLMTIVGVLYLTVRPFSLSVYRRLASQLGMASFLDALAILLPNTTILLTGDSDVPSPVGTSLMVSNHVVDADWWGMLMVGRCVGLRGTLKAFLRNEYLRIHSHPTRQQNASILTTSISSNMVGSLTTSTTRINGGSPSGSPNSSSQTNGSSRRFASRDVSVFAQILNRALEYPLLNGEENSSDREQLFTLLRSFAENNGASSSVHLLFYPESWSLHNGADRESVHDKSNEFAKREGKPQLKHLLLPRTRAFKSSLECLRESSPLVYDVTMAYTGYDGSLPLSKDFSMLSLWKFLRCDFPKEIHVRIKRYSMEEVLQDAGWLDKKWAEKDRLLAHFARHQSFPIDNRGYSRPRIFNTRQYSVESSTVALARLLLLPCAVPVLILLSIPLFWTLLSIWLAQRAFQLVFPDPNASRNGRRGPNENGSDNATETPINTSAPSTPHCPATPFGSPSVSTWAGDMFTGRRS